MRSPLRDAFECGVAVEHIAIPTPLAFCGSLPVSLNSSTLSETASADFGYGGAEAEEKGEVQQALVVYLETRTLTTATQYDAC
jgi:hypothetical protein